MTHRFYPWIFTIVLMIIVLSSTSAHVPGTSLSHNSAGGLESVTFGNGFITTVTPDVRNRPATWVTGIGLDDLLNNDFVYDAFGNIAEIGSDDYGYDILNRLTTSTVNGTSFGYSYDSVGNIETVTKGGSPVGSFGYNNNKIEALLPSGYDADGNLIDDGVNAYVYDALGQTASVTNSGGTVGYRYDALGKRILANDGSVDTVYAYLGEQLIAEYTGVDYTNSVFLEGQLLARVTDNGVDTTTVRYAHLNHLGSPVAFTDGTAAVVWPEQVGGTPYEIHNYEPFGADFDDIGTPALSPQDVRYTGKLFESETGKHYFNARYLNAVTDSAAPELPPRFLSPDIVIGTPESPQSWNRYVSVANNPVNYIDPSGLVNFRVDPTGAFDMPMQDIYVSPVNDVVTASSRELSLGDQVMGFTLMIGGPAGLAFAESGGVAWGMIQLYRWALPASRAAEMAVDEFATGGAGLSASKRVSVIGPRATYRQFAKEIGAKFLDVTDDAWTWKKNEKFLAGIVNRGDDVLFAGKFSPAKLDPKSVLAREIKYLSERGYKWTDDFSKLIKQ